MESYLTAEISASAVAHNLSVLRSMLRPSTRLCAVVKADCYGHGAETLLKVIARHVDVLGVATPMEAISLRRLDYNGPIMTFFSACAYDDGQELRDALEALISSNVTLTVVAPPEVEAVAEAAQRVGTTASVHVKIDTGMGRSGVLPAAAPALAEQVRRQAHVRLTGLYTHFATADEEDQSFMRHQLMTFMDAVRACGGHKGLTIHAANSAAMVSMRDSHLDMVRPGLAVYGYQPSESPHHRVPLRPALRLWGRLMQIKTLPARSRCGYGLTHEFTCPSRVGLVPVGYGDGYFRCLSNRGVAMRVRGRDVPVCGRVSMDQVIIDLTSVPQARVGDQVEIISPVASAANSVENLARLAQTIPYEITCRLGRRVRRVLVQSFGGGQYVPDRLAGVPV